MVLLHGTHIIHGTLTKSYILQTASFKQYLIYQLKFTVHFLWSSHILWQDYTLSIQCEYAITHQVAGCTRLITNLKLVYMRNVNCHIVTGVQEAIFDWSGKVNMHDDVIDLWARHCICGGIATPGLAKASAQANEHYGQSNNCKNTITGMQAYYHNVSICYKRKCDKLCYVSLVSV